MKVTVTWRFHTALQLFLLLTTEVTGGVFSGCGQQ
jgi:hypothetical protein